MRRAFMLFVVLLCAGCASTPVPLRTGDAVETPNACKEIIARGGKC